MPWRRAGREQLARCVHDENAVRGRDADAQDRAGQRGHRQRGARDEQHPCDAGERCRQSADDHERIEPRLEVHDHQQVDQRDREREAAEQPRERLVHRLHLAAQHDRRAGRQLRARGVDELRHVARDAAEVAPLHGREDVEHRLHVVVRHHGLLRRARERAERAEQVLRGRPRGRAAGRRLRRAGGAGGQRHVRERLQRIHRVLRRLHEHRVADAVARIEPEVRRRLRAAGQRDQQVLRDVALVETGLDRLRTIDVHVDSGFVAGLLDARVDEPAHAAQLREQRVRDRAVLVELVADDLDVDRRGQSEVEDLADDVGRQERERHAGERLREHVAQLRDVRGGRRVIRLQRDEHVGVLGADRVRRVVREVDPAHRHADVVEYTRELVRRNRAADLRFHFVGEPRGFLDPRAGRRAQMQANLAGVDRRKEVLPGERVEARRCDAGEQERGREAAAARDCRRQQRAIAQPHGLEAMLERGLEPRDACECAARRPAAAFGAHQRHRKRRHQRAREEVRRDHREDHGFGERHEQIARDTREQEHWHEHDADRQRRHEGRHRDFARAGEDRFVERRAELEMMCDVLDRDGRVVDENADREREPAQRHDVDGLPEHGQREQRREHRERNRDRDDQRRAPAAEEQQDHQRGQARGDQRFAHDALDRRLHEHGLIVERRDAQRVRQPGRDLRQHRLHLVDDRQRRCAAGLLDRQQRRALAVHPHDVGLRRVAVANVRDVAHVHDVAADRLHRQVVQRGDRLRAAVHLHVVFVRADFRGAARQDQVLRVDRVHDVDRREPLRLQRARIEIDDDLADLAAERQRHRRALDGRELRADEAVAEVVQLLLGERVARQPELQDRHRRRVVRDDVRRQRAGRQDAQDRRGVARGLRDRAIDVGARVEEHLHDRHAVQRLRLDVLDVVDVGRERAFVVRRDPLGHVLGGEAVVRPDDADDRNVDVRKDVGRRAQQCQRPRDEDQQREYDERVGPA
ncbi:putative autotransporter protein [Burkholderia cenocepacia]|nr:putative autotransporter protein [Burkholderia cenocepacia]